MAYVEAPLENSSVGWQTASRAVPVFEVDRIREDFPILAKVIRGNPLTYLDNAATSQKPKGVIDVINHYYSEKNSNIHRGVHYLSEQSTIAYEESREKIRKYFNARHSKEIVFVRGTTEAINLVAQTYGRKNITAGDQIVLSEMEHHSNIIPWQLLSEQTGAVIRVIPINENGELDLNAFARLLDSKTKLVAITHVSNALGTINPIREIIESAHQVGVPVLVDGAQAAPHFGIDLQDLDCDFYAVSGHKMYAPTGIGILYGKSWLLENMPPYQGGGDMITRVSFEKSVYHRIPHRFEAGTPNIAGAIGLGAAVDYLSQVDMFRAAEHEERLLNYAEDAIQQIPGLTVIGTADEKAGIISFVLKGIHPHDIATILDQQGIAVRAGHHCSMPVMERLGLTATTRASFAFYNTKEDVDRLIDGLFNAIKVFK